MDNEKITEFFIKLTTELASLNTNMKNVLDRLTNHENRLMELELKEKENTSKNSLFQQLVPFLIKGLLICLGIIGTLTGSGALLKDILNQHTNVSNVIEK